MHRDLYSSAGRRGAGWLPQGQDASAVFSLRNLDELAHFIYGIFTFAPLYFLQFGCYGFGFVPGENAMDVVYIALIVGFFALSMGLIYFFEALRGPK